MTAEYTVNEGETIGDLARELLAAAEALGHSPDVIAWSHRPDTPGGGVFIVTADEVAAEVLARRQVRAEQLRAALDREAAQLDEESGDDGDDDAASETPAEDGKPQTTAQKRRAAKKAAAEAEAKAADEAKAAAEAEAAKADAQTETLAPEAGAEQKSE